jgi:hypothetical protein
MKRYLVLPALLLAVLALAATAWANGGPGDHGKRGQHGHHGKSGHHAFFFGPFQMTSTDNSSCSTPWAQDTFKRIWVVKPHKDGTFRVGWFDFGRFVTTGPASPGACETNTKHGTVVTAGVKGHFHGFLRGTVSGGTFNPNATCIGPDCGSRSVFITTHFGAAATFSCDVNSTDCKFRFGYHAKNQGLALHHWVDAGRGAGTSLQERFKGDISTDRVS